MKTNCSKLMQFLLILWTLLFLAACGGGGGGSSSPGPDKVVPKKISQTITNNSVGIPVNTKSVGVSFDKNLSKDLSTISAVANGIAIDATKNVVGGNELEIVFASTLSCKTEYTLNFNAVDTIGNMAATEVIKFTTENCPNPTTPKIVSSTPVAGAINVSQQTKAITITFNEPVLESSVNAQTIKLSCITNDFPLTLSLSTNKETVTGTWVNDLIFLNLCKVSVNGVLDLGILPNPLVTEFSFTVEAQVITPPPPTTHTCWDNSVLPIGTDCPPQPTTHECPDHTVLPIDTACPSPDTTAPTLVSSSIVDGATDVAVSVSSIKDTFDEILSTTGTNVTTVTLMIGSTNVLIDVSIVGKEVSIAPKSLLAFSTTYTRTITAKDASGNTTVKILSFTTVAPPDTTAPTIVTSTPVASAVNVLIATNVVTVTMSEKINPATVNANTFKLDCGSLNFPLTVSLSSNQLTPTGTFTGPLPFLTLCKINVNGFKDLAGNTTVTSVTFTTEAGPAPVITLSSPINKAVNVAQSTRSITLVSNKVLDLTTVSTATIKLACGSTIYPLQTSVLTDNVTITASFASSLSFSDSCKVDVNGVKGLSTNPAVSSFTFTVEPAPTTPSPPPPSDTTPPVVVSQTMADGTTGLAAGFGQLTATVTYNETLGSSSYVTLTGNGASIPISVTVSGSNLTFVTSGAGTPSTTYTATFIAVDVAGNWAIQKVIHFSTN